MRSVVIWVIGGLLSLASIAAHAVIIDVPTDGVPKYPLFGLTKEGTRAFPGVTANYDTSRGILDGSGGIYDFYNCTNYSTCTVQYASNSHLAFTAFVDSSSNEHGGTFAWYAGIPDAGVADDTLLLLGHLDEFAYIGWSSGTVATIQMLFDVDYSAPQLSVGDYWGVTLYGEVSTVVRPSHFGCNESPECNVNPFAFSSFGWRPVLTADVGSVVPVPEPPITPMLAVGLLVLSCVWRRRMLLTHR